MADLIRWFHDLEPVERTAAMAVIDDEKFVTFYMNILRDEHHQSKSGASHALFMIDYLEILYDKASRKKPISSKDKFGNFLDYEAEQSAERPSSANDPSLLSFLSSGRVTGSDTSDFDDPYYMPFIAQDNISRLPNCSIGCRDTEITTSSSAYSPSNDSGTPTPTDKSECSTACAKNSGLLSVSGKHSEASFSQTDNKLENKHLISDSSHDKKRTVKEEEPMYRTNGCLNDNFGLAADLHQAATTSFATSGSGAFDSLFIMRPATEDSHRLVAIFEELSDCRMFSIRPSFQDIMDTFSSSNKSLPMVSWLADILRPKEVGTRPRPVSYYTILLSRIELSLWHTFYISTGYHTPSPSSAIPPVHGNTDVDDEFNAVVGSFNSVTLLPRTRSSKKNKNSAPVKAVLAPVRNSMVVLERSSLQRLSCAAVMLSLGCIIEEHKASWRVMSKTDMLAIISHFPAASTFYSNPKNSRGRSETVVDRLVLCPLLWIMNTVAEQEVKGAYRHLEAVVAGSSRNSSNSSSWGPQAMDYADLTGIPRLGIKIFDENANRTGAMGFIHPVQSSSGSCSKEALKEGVGEPSESRTTSKASVGLSKRNVVRAVQPPRPVPKVVVPVEPDIEEVIERDKSVEVDTTPPMDVSTHPQNVDNDICNGERLTSTVNEDDYIVPLLAELQELAGDTTTSYPTSKKALKSVKAKTKAAVPQIIKEPIPENGLELVLESGSDSPAREETWTDPWCNSDDACATVEAEEHPYPVTSDDILCASTEPSDQPSQGPVTVTAPPGFEPHHSPHAESDAPTLELDDLSELGTMSRSADEVDGKDLLIDCDRPPIVTPSPKPLVRLQHPLHHPSLSADQDSVYYESARNSGRGTPDTSDIINALEGFQGMHGDDYESAFLSARSSGKDRRSSRDSNDSFLSSHRSKRSAKSNRNHNMDVLYASYHSGKDSPPRLHSHHSDGSVTDYKSNRKMPSIGIVTGGPLFANRRNTAFDRGVSSSSSSSIGSFSPADMNDERAGCYLGQEEHSPVNKKDHYSMSSEERNRDRHQQRAHVPELWHLRFDPNSPSQSPRGSNPSSFSVPFGPGQSKSPISIGSSSPTGPFVDGRPRSRPSTPREELWGHNNVIHHLNARGIESLGGVQGQGRGQNQNQNQSGYGHGVVLTPERSGRMYENRRYDPNQNQHHNQQQQQQQQTHHHHHHQMNGNNSNIINNNINNNNGVYNQNNCYNGKINNNNNNNNNSNSNNNNSNNNNSHNNNSNMNNGNLNFNDFNYNGSHQFENNNDQRNRQQIARCRSGPYRGMPNNPRADKEMEFKIKAALRLQKLLTKNIRSFNNIMSGRMDVHKLVRIAVFLELRSMVLSLWPTAVVRIFGSCVTGLALPSSDIDIVIQLTRQQQYRPPYPNNTPYQNTAQPALYYQGHRSKPPAQFYQYAPPLSLQQPLTSKSEERVASAPGSGSGPAAGAGPVSGSSADSLGKGRTSTPPCPPSVDTPTTPTSEPSTPCSPTTEAVEAVVCPTQSRSSSTDTDLVRDCVSPAVTRSPSQCPTPLTVDAPPRQRSPSAPALPDGALHYISVMGFPVLPPAPPSQEMFNSLFFALTSQLYMQIWASEVNPIPSATVPVIKFRVAADALLSNPIVQQAVFLAHQQQLLSPILEPAIFPLPVINPAAHARGPHHDINPHLRFPPCFTSTSPITTARERPNSKASKRDRAQSTSEEGSLSERSSASYLRHNSSDSADVGMNWVGLTPQGSDQFDGIAPPMPPQFPPLYQQQLQQQQQQQQQQQHMFLYPPQSPNSPFTIGGSGQSPNHPPDHGQSILGGQGKYPQPFVPPTPFFALLPFHLAAGVSIAVDLTIEAGQHEGLSSSDFVQQTLSTRSAVLPAVVKVVKALLVQSKFNVPFSGGLSSYSAFLLVLAAYDRCQYSDLAATMARRGGHHSWSHGSNLNEADGGLHGTAEIENGIGYGSSGRVVTEGEVLIHFLALYSSPNVGFQSSCQGIDVRAEPSMLIDLNPDQQASIAGGGLWIVDPRDPTKNVARPTFAFKQAQQYFKQCLDKIESAAANASLSGTDSSSVDFLKLLIRY